MPEVDDPPAVKEIASALPKQDAPVTTAKQNSVETQRSIKQPPRLQSRRLFYTALSFY